MQVVTEVGTGSLHGQSSYTTSNLCISSRHSSCTSTYLRVPMVEIQTKKSQLQILKIFMNGRLAHAIIARESISVSSLY